MNSSLSKHGAIFFFNQFADCGKKNCEVHTRAETILLQLKRKYRSIKTTMNLKDCKALHRISAEKHQPVWWIHFKKHLKLNLTACEGYTQIEGHSTQKKISLKKKTHLYRSKPILENRAAPARKTLFFLVNFLRIKATQGAKR